MIENVSASNKNVLMPILGAKIYKLGENRWQIVTAASALTMNCPEELLSGVVGAFGVASADELADSLSERFDRDVVSDFIGSLIAKDVIYIKGGADAPPVPDRLFHLLPAAKEESRNAVFQPSAHSLLVLGSGRTHDEVRRMAQQSGYRIASPDGDAADKASMILVASDEPNHDLFRELNRAQVVERRIPAIFSYIDGNTARLFRVVPGATACFECLHHRMRVGKTFYREFDAASSGRALWFEDALPVPALQAQQLAATTMIQASLMLARSIQDLHENHLIELLAFNEMKRKVPVLKLPRCPVCGPGNTAQPFAPIYNPAIAQG